MPKATKTKATKNGAAKNGTRRPWTDADKERAIAVYTTTGSLSETSRRTGMPISTLRGYLAKQPPQEIQQARLDARKEFVRKAWAAVGAYLDRLQQKEVVNGTSARDGATIVGILIDKIQLVTGKPTGISRLEGEVTDKHVYDLTAKIVGENPAILRTIFARDTERDLEGGGGPSARVGLGELH